MAVSYIVSSSAKKFSSNAVCAARTFGAAASHACDSGALPVIAKSKVRYPSVSTSYTASVESTEWCPRWANSTEALVPSQLTRTESMANGSRPENSGTSPSSPSGPDPGACAPPHMSAGIIAPPLGPCASARPTPSAGKRQNRRCPEAVDAHKKSPLQSTNSAAPCASSYASASTTSPPRSVTSTTARPGHAR